MDRGSAHQQRSGTAPLASSTQLEKGSWELSQAHRTHTNCHQAIRSVWWPHSDLSHRRAIPYPTGKRHTGLDAALQPDLFRDCSSALPAGHRLPSTASWRCKPDCTATRSARCTASWKPTAWWKLWPARASTCAISKAPRNQNTAAHPQSGHHRPRPRSAQMRGWPAQCRLHAATDP